ncbi:MAG: hypothetical protein J0I09_10745 [Sphingobacteriia bacterium]|nr:hypothetical protein [Sphingobacteriia bacterium]
MNAALYKSLYHLTQQQDLQSVSEESLIAYTNKYPYFSPVQFILAAKLKSENSYQAAQQIQRAALYTNNPVWIEHGLLNGKVQEPHFTFIETTPVNPVISEQPVVSPATEAITGQTPVVTEIIPSTTKPNDIPTVESVKELLQKIDAAPAAKNNSNIITAGTTLPNYTSFFNNKPDTPEELPEEEADEEHFNHPDNIAALEEKQAEKLSSVLSNQMADFKKPVQQTEKLDYESEPLYTIDYFASQGIKFDYTKQPQDKLTQQLMKFTDWLKILKKSGSNPTDLGTDPELENAIQGIAQTSNESKEIITETMADVFVKQGKVDKAVQLYIKLSFLDPEKSAYFAAKIQELKGI